MPKQIDENSRAKALLDTGLEVLAMIARGKPVSQVLEIVARTVEEQSDGLLCSVLLLDQDGRRLRYAAAPSLPKEYIRATDGVLIGPSVGSCGTAAYRAEPVIVTDIARDPLWANYRDLALSYGLRACWSTPILSSRSGVLGALAMYYREPRRPDPVDLRLVEISNYVVGIAVERVLSEPHQIRKQMETIKRLAQDIHGQLLSAVFHSEYLLKLTAERDPLRRHPEAIRRDSDKAVTLTEKLMTLTHN